MSAKIVSVIMPSYNSEDTINQAIDSVVNQDYPFWELIVIDDCSTDNSKKLVERYDDSRIRFIRNSINRGSAYSRNIGLEVSTGDFICFLDSDDYWAETKLSTQVKILEKATAPALVISSYIRVSSKGEAIKTIKVPGKVNYKQLLKTNSIPCLTTMITADIAKKHSFKKVGHEDYLFWLNVLAEGCAVIGIEQPLAFYRTGNLSLSSNKFKAAGFQWKIYRRELGFGFIRSGYYFLFYAINGLRKELF